MNPPLHYSVVRSVQLKQHIHFELGIFVVGEAKVELVNLKALTVDFPSIGAAVTVGA